MYAYSTERCAFGTFQCARARQAADTECILELLGIFGYGQNKNIRFEMSHWPWIQSIDFIWSTDGTTNNYADQIVI